jgi:hypothetical protein
MGRIRRLAVPSSLAIGALLLGSVPALAAGQAPATAAKSAAPTWRLVQWFPSTTGLTAVAAVSRRNAWAVGQAGKAGSAAVFHWQGKTWKRVTVRGLSPRLTLMNVEATSASDVWIFGINRSGQYVVRRNDGKSWTSVPVPPASVNVATVVVLGADNAWWWGQSTGPAGSTIWHWNGKVWSATTVRGDITDVAGAGRTVWVATQPTASPARATILRWTGSGWRSMAFPDKRRLYWPQVAVAANGQGWVQDAPVRGQWSVYHWTGRAWQRIKVPAYVNGRPVSMTNLMTFDGHSGVWFQGTVHWNGRRWIVPAMSPSSLTIFAMQAPVAPIPRTTGTWGIGFINTSRTATAKYRYFLALEGIAP